MMLKVLILAAGKGTRMKSEKPKVLFEVAGRPMIDYVIDAAGSLSPDEIIVITGNKAETVEKHLQDHPLKDKIRFVLQKEQNGTGHAVMCAKEFLNYDGKVLILCGDMPLIKPETLEKFYSQSQSNVSLITVKVKNPEGYGRIVRGADKKIIKIVEEKDASEKEKLISEINTGIYLIYAKELLNRLKTMKNNNAQNEYYLTDIVKKGADIFAGENEEEFIGINNKIELAKASKIIWEERCRNHMMQGVEILDMTNCYIDKDVKIGKDTIIYPNVTIKGSSAIGKNCIIYPGCRIENSTVSDKCEIKDNTLIEDSFVGENCSVGPMAHLRPKTKLLGNNKIGNFVETKKAEIGTGSKASHLTYLGDCKIGKDVNIGCGTITCNYDGISKHETVIGDNVFVGSDVQFVAPVKIGSGSLVGAGSTITIDVPEGALAITRAEQKNIEGWVKKWTEKKKKEAEKCAE